MSIYGNSATEQGQNRFDKDILRVVRLAQDLYRDTNNIFGSIQHYIEGRRWYLERSDSGDASGASSTISDNCEELP